MTLYGSPRTCLRRATLSFNGPRGAERRAGAAAPGVAVLPVARVDAVRAVGSPAGDALSPNRPAPVEVCSYLTDPLSVDHGAVGHAGSHHLHGREHDCRSGRCVGGVGVS